MPGLESTMICLDNSEWMRNGDHFPTRLDAQQDAVNLLMTARIDSHPENTVGVLSMGGKGVEMLVSPTEDMKKLLATFGKISISGKCQFCNAVQIAHLALKHRKNKNGGQRIIVFIGSPIQDTSAEMKKIGSILKKNSVAVDVVLLGELEDIQGKVLEFVNAANSNDNCHVITVPAGVNPADAIISSPLLGEFGGGGFGGDVGASAEATGDGAPAAGGGQFAEYGGIDPNLDPELAMAIRASVEEARAHEASRAAAAAEETPAESGVAAPEISGAENSEAAPVAAPAANVDEEDEEALLQAALAISMQGTPAPAATEAPAAPVEMEVDDDDEEALQAAMLLSLAGSAPADAETPPPAPSSEPAAAPSTVPAAGTFMDTDFVNQLLGSVEVDPNDPFIVAAREQFDAAQSEQKKSDDSKKDDSKK